jgi:phage host-nuclease inhibitor protein Gam
MAIANEADLDLALAELGRLAALEKGLSAKCDQRCSEIREQFQQKMIVELDGEDVPLHVARQQLETAIEFYANQHREQLLAGLRTKSRRFTHGTIGWQFQRAGLKCVDATGPKAWLSELAAKLLPQLHKLLAKCCILPDVPFESFVDLELSWSKKRILDAYASEKLKAAQLKKLGWKLIPGREQFKIEPAESDVQSFAAQPAGSE